MAGKRRSGKRLSTPRRRAEAAEREQREADRLARRTKCMKMRLEGHDFEVIADKCGYGSRQAAWDDYHRALDAVAAENEATTDQARRVELARLDKLQTIAWAKTGDAEPAIALKAVETVLKISAHRARMLGLDQPVKHEISFDAVEARITELTAFLEAHGAEDDDADTDA